MKNLEEKLDKINERLTSIDITLAKQATELEHHIYRTDLAEAHIKKLEQQIKPIEGHVAQVSGVLKFFGGLAILGGMIKAIIEVVNFLN